MLNSENTVSASTTPTGVRSADGVRGRQSDGNDTGTLFARLGVVLAATAAAAAVWAVEAHGLGIKLLVGKTAASATHVDLANAIGAALVAGLAAWALLAYLERRNPAKGARTWTIIACVAFVVSLLGPSTGIAGSAKLALMCLHTLVAVILIIGLRWSARPRTR